MWAIEVVLAKHSFSSCDTKSELFSAMFADSQIAQKFSGGQTKCKYLVCNGIAPYFQEVLTKSLAAAEQHNQVVKKGQMDVHVRFWDTSMNVVRTRYYNSKFMRKAAAADVLKTFKDGVKDLDEGKLLQVSMDGPNVNMSFLSALNEDRMDRELSHLISIGSCGLHTVHNSLKHGEKASGWNLEKLLSSIFKIFHESPSRRAVYEMLTEAEKSDYPLQFCGHRWVENENVAKRARIVWPKVVTVVAYWKGLAKSKQPEQGKPGQNTSYDHLCLSYKDVLIPLKIQFFEEIARSLNAFLLTFQSDKPMAVFLVETLDQLLRSFCSKFVKKEVLSVTSTLALSKFNLHDSSNHVFVSLVDVGFGLKQQLKELKSSGKITDRQEYQFKSDALQFLATLCTHMKEKSPLSSSFAR